MGYGQWCQITLANKSGKTISTKNLNWISGKYFAFPDPSVEVDSKTIDNQNIADKKVLSFAQCGKENATWGCDSSLELWCGETKICKLYWSVPHGSNTDCELTLSEQTSSDWVVNLPPYYKPGSLGSVTVSVFYTGDD
ncbi:Asp-hemolysin [Orbilia brochopaga]|nr:Asp-hemolysin [Drechslerella brochopaga]